MNHKITLSLLVAGAAATYAGFSFSGNASGPATQTEFASPAPIIVARVASEQATDPEPFSTMAVADGKAKCDFYQRPPKSLADTAYLRGGFAAIRKTMAVEKWKDTGSCECFYDQITWADTVAEASKYTESGKAHAPLDVVQLQQVSIPEQNGSVSRCKIGQFGRGLAAPWRACFPYS